MSEDIVIIKAIDYIEGHLLEDINYMDVVKSLYMSCFHFHRLFSTIVGISANEYIRNRPLT